ncbi:hypothetical protein BDV28DRAFT_132291 [Aspergillus coremiiformis]|uniref:Cell surface protein n=1 Tax=Aspergillus coremiiformis TaxID=138285 RepID=A0A5N6Z8A0_9EURO|nr:hypothetical protein BDV28DRAFT_132291 [Aspergillus coremiiformis]
MSSTQPPYDSSSFGNPTQHPGSSQPVGTQVGVVDPSDPRTGPAPRTAGPHKSDIINKLDPRVDSDLSKLKQSSKAGVAGAGAGNIHTGSAQKTAGLHTSDTGNKLDPRVDSDFDNGAQYAPGATKTGNVNPHATQDASFGSGPNAGPHQSDMMNKLDPRVNAQTGDMSTKTTSQHPGTQFSNDPRSPSGTNAGVGYAPGSVGYRPA